MRGLHGAHIIAVGSELLTPFRIDTNSLFLTRRLNDLGIPVLGKSIVGDDRDHIATRVREALSQSDVVIVTGGLGPTADDLTREAVGDVLALEFAEDEPLLDSIRRRFVRRGAVMPEINRRQAMVPRGARVMNNAAGTAPGLILETPAALVVLLPGPPRELQPMFDADVVPLLEQRRGERSRQLARRVVKVTGRSESQVEEIAQPIYSMLGDADTRVETTILATPGQIELHLAALGVDRERLEAVLSDGVRRLSDAIGDAVFSTDDRSLEEVVGEQLRARGWMVAAAESCTGGLVLGRLTEIGGSSAWVCGGVVAYADRIKVEQLNVSPVVLQAHGAVSEPVALAMAAGVRERLAADVGVAVTGIAGPSGGSEQKPVGTVVIAVASPSATVVKTFHFPGDRETVRRHSVAAALNLIRAVSV